MKEAWRNIGTETAIEGWNDISNDTLIFPAGES